MEPVNASLESHKTLQILHLRFCPWLLLELRPITHTHMLHGRWGLRSFRARETGPEGGGREVRTAELGVSDPVGVSPWPGNVTHALSQRAIMISKLAYITSACP